METWATPSLASQITRDSLTQDDLVAATHVVELYTGVIPEEPPENLKAMDLRYLKKAEAYQAAWMKKQVDYTGRSDTNDVDYDGVRFTKGNDDMHILAPLARQAIRNLSWKRGKSIEALTPTQALVLRGKRTASTYGLHRDGVGKGFDADEDGLPWEPM